MRARIIVCVFQEIELIPVQKVGYATGYDHERFVPLSDSRPALCEQSLPPAAASRLILTCRSLLLLSSPATPPPLLLRVVLLLAGTPLFLPAALHYVAPMGNCSLQRLRHGHILIWAAAASPPRHEGGALTARGAPTLAV
jgi:hypothetical protein